jgi:hypothetical protein
VRFISIEEEERQMILLALAQLALERPGWDDALTRIAQKMDNTTSEGKAEMFEAFKKANADKYPQTKDLSFGSIPGGVVCYPCTDGRHSECYKSSRYFGLCYCTVCNQKPEVL